MAHVQLIAPESLKKEFDRQMALGAKQIDENQLKPLFKLLKHIDAVHVGEGWLPFVIVLQGTIPLTVRMTNVVLKGKSGENHFTDALVTDLEETSPRPYLIVDVEDGRAKVCGFSLRAKYELAEQGRRVCTVIEGISTVTYNPEILESHFIDLPGSRYKQTILPYLYRQAETKQPGLGENLYDGANPFCGTMSCRARFIPMS